MKLKSEIRFVSLNTMFRPRTDVNLAFIIIYLSSYFVAFAIYGFDKWWLYAYLIHAFILTFGVGFGYHRVIIHICAEVFLPVRRFAAAVATLSNTGSAITWGSSHYLHHSFPDTDKDPHSPEIYGFKILLGFYNTDQILKSYRKIFPAIRHISKDRFLVFLHNYYYVIIFSFYLLTFIVGGPKGFLFFGLIPSGTSYLSILAVNYFNHGKRGYRNFLTSDHSNNVWWLWPLLFGENWHNNHHQFPNKTTTRHRFWEIDPISFYFYIFDRSRYAKIKPLLSRNEIDRGYNC